MKFKEKYCRYLIIGILIILINSCTQKKIELSFKTYSDKMNKFKIDIPKNWKVDKLKNKYSSTITFADTTKPLDNVIIYDIMWDSTKIYMNEHFKSSLDSIVSNHKQKISKQSFDSINGFKTYRFDAIELDTINNIRLIKTHNYLKDYNKDGHLIFTYSRVKENMSKTDLTITKRIIKTIKRE